MVTLIAACDKGFGIAKDGVIPWVIDGDLRRFRSVTMGGVCIMGRVTADTLPNALDGRVNVVLSGERYQRDSFWYGGKSVSICANYHQKKLMYRNIFIIGGESVYKQALDEGVVDEIDLTVIDSYYSCDRRLPDVYSYGFKVVDVQPLGSMAKVLKLRI